MWNSRDRNTTLIVCNALRKYASAIQQDIKNFHLDPDRSEELDEAIRLTRTMRSATSLVGSFELNRLAALQEEVLESIASQGCGLDDDALSVLTTMLEAMDAHIVRIESHLDQPAEDAVEAREDLIPAVKAFRRFRDLPEDGDDQAITSLFSTSPAFGNPSGVQSAGETREDNSSAEQTPRVVDGGHEAVSADALAADQSRQQELPPELWEIFRDEANDHIERIHGALRQLEKDHANRELIQEIRRSAHTLKGSAAAVGLRVVSQLSHRAEDLLDALYGGDVELNSELLNLLAATADMLYDMFAGDAEAWNDENLRDLYAAYDLHCGTAESDGKDNSQLAVDRAPSQSGAAAEISAVPAPNSTAATQNPRQASYVRVPTARVEALRRVVSESIVNRAAIEQGVAGFSRCAAALMPVLDMLRDVYREMESHRKAGRWCNSGRAVLEGVAPDGQLLIDRRSDLAEFDELEFDRFTNFDLWSQSLAESSTAIGNVQHDLRSLVDDCDALLAQQSRLILETQDRLFRIQMVPLATIMPRLHRAVRDVATRESKNVELLVDGDDVELDKTVLEEMVEPLLHLLRNAVDHGIEPTDERAAKGKPAAAFVRISLSHFGTQVVIRVSDDGQGLDADKIRASALKGGYLSKEEADSLSPQQLYRHIFLPGFSTASSVSEISGRGVGMDVVRTKIEELKGRIDVDSVPDRGTSFTIRLPVSLAVTRALMLVAANDLFAIPQKAVNSIVRVATNDDGQFDERQKICVDGKEYTLIDLRDYLGIESVSDRPSDSRLIAILGSGSQQVALQVDGILPGRDIVVKPVENQFATASGLLGATILGDGTVVPILDPTDLINSNDADRFQAFEGVPDRSAAALPATIMIVEDSVSMRHVLQNVVEQAGWCAVTARDGIDALETLASLEEAPVAFLLDVEMPRMDGYDLLKTLRQEEAFTETPIIMITSRSGEKHRQRAFSLGASAYLTKPVEDDALIETIQQHLA